jgi:hypothetical protein
VQVRFSTQSFGSKPDGFSSLTVYEVISRHAACVVSAVIEDGVGASAVGFASSEALQ